jgi:hypothetical protein
MKDDRQTFGGVSTIIPPLSVNNQKSGDSINSGKLHITQAWLIHMPFSFPPLLTRPNYYLPRVSSYVLFN